MDYCSCGDTSILSTAKLRASGFCKIYSTEEKLMIGWRRPRTSMEEQKPRVAVAQHIWIPATWLWKSSQMLWSSWWQRHQGNISQLRNTRSLLPTMHTRAACLSSSSFFLVTKKIATTTDNTDLDKYYI